MSFVGDSIDAEIEVTSEGWADFDPDDKPRIIMLVGSFGIKSTAPVTWLIEEYGIEMVCVLIETYKELWPLTRSVTIVSLSIESINN